MGPASFTPSALQYGPETCQRHSSVLNSSTQKAYTSTLNWKRHHNGAGQGSHCHTPPRGTDNATAVPSRISAALFSNRMVVRGSSAGKESHIPEEGERARERRWPARAEAEVSSWPSLTPQGSPLARTPVGVLSSYYMTAVSVGCTALKFQSQAAIDIQILSF